MIKKVIPTYWYRSANFGDRIAPYLVEKISGYKTVYVGNDNMEIEHIALVGSLLDTTPLSNTHVWGCGFAYESGHTYQPKVIHAVRGALSRQRYLANDIECPEVYGDPAILLPKYYSPDIQKKFRLGIIPHTEDYINVLARYSNLYADTLIINLSDSVEAVIDQILSCEKTISSSLHGLIVSHAYGVPSRWVEFSDKVIGQGFKFRDYFTTVSADEIPIDLRAMPDVFEIYSEISGASFYFNHPPEKLLQNCPL